MILLLFQKSCPVVHILYDNLCDILMKCLRRFIKPQGLENKYGTDLISVDCTKCKRNFYWRKEKKATERSASWSIENCLVWNEVIFQGYTITFEKKLPLGNELFRQLGCSNPTKRHKQSTVLSIQIIASVLQPKINSAEVVDSSWQWTAKLQSKWKDRFFLELSIPVAVS